MAATGQTSAAVAAFKEIEGSQTIKLENVRVSQCIEWESSAGDNDRAG